jgi:hypothetical protein
MSLTKRQKMLSAVFLVGVVGLVADRTILRPQGGPQAASADSGSPTQDVASGNPSVPALPSATVPDRAAGAQAVPARPDLAERLNDLLAGKVSDPNEPRDPFSLPAAWSDTVPVSGERAPDAVRGFIRSHQLRAIVVQGGQSCAQVDDSFLVPGQSLDGFALVSLDHRCAIFEHNGKRAVLELAGE